MKNSSSSFPMGKSRPARTGMAAVGSSKTAGPKAKLPKRQLGKKVAPSIPDARSAKGVKRK